MEVVSQTAAPSAAQSAQALHILTDPTRFRLVELLLEHPYCVKALAKKLGISEPAVSQHLRVLKRYQLAEGKKIGYQTHYQVKRERILSLLDVLRQQVAQTPPKPMLTRDRDCVCEFLSDCIKRDAKLLEEQGYGSGLFDTQASL